MGYMKLRRHILFHMDKRKTFSIFYDEEEKLFYRKYTKVNTNPIYLCSGITATLTSYGVSKITILSLISIPFLTVFISFLLAIVFVAITLFLVEKNVDTTNTHYFYILNEDYLYSLVVEGERSLKGYMKLIIGIFIVAVGVMLALFVMPDDPVLFLCHTVFWWLFLFMTFTGNIFKRKKLYRTLRKRIE